MSVGKRGKLAVLVALILLLTTLFLVACSSADGGNVRLSDIIASVDGTSKSSGESGKESAPSGDATAQTSQTDADATVPNDGQTSTDNAVATDQTVEQDGAASGQNTQTQGANDQTQTANGSDAVQNQDADGGLAEDGTNNEEKSDISDQTEQNETNDQTQDQEDTTTEEALHEGYYRITVRDTDGVWTLVAGSSEIGSATITEDGVLYTSDLTQTVVELWGADDAYGNIVPYLYFDALGMKEVYFRDEQMVVQIDLFEEDLAALLPEKEENAEQETPSQDNTDEQNPGDDETDDEQGGASDQNGELTPQQDEDQPENQQDVADEQNDGNEEQNVDDESSDETPGSDEQQGSDEQGSEQQGVSETPVLNCALCGADLLAGGHLEDCEHYAVLPAESAAYSWLSALTGVWEDSAVTALAEDVEIYSLVLNYMDEAGMSALTEALLASDAVLMDALSNGVRYLSVQKEFEEKPFMIEAQIQRNGEYYKADLSLTFALD